MFTLTKREKENENHSKIDKKPKIPEKKSIKEEFKRNLINVKSPKNGKETSNKEKNTVNIETFLRYSQKFRDLKAMQKDLEKLLSNE